MSAMEMPGIWKSLNKTLTDELEKSDARLDIPNLYHALYFLKDMAEALEAIYKDPARGLLESEIRILNNFRDWK